MHRAAPLVIRFGILSTQQLAQASQVGNEAVDVLETAKEYFGQPLKAWGHWNVLGPWDCQQL